MSIAVLDKAFSVLEVLARSGRELTLAELAAEGRLPKPTVHRILRSLRDLGYVDQTDRRGNYRLSDRLISLRQHGRDAAVRKKALPLMTRLHSALDETVNLGLLEGVYVRYAHVLETNRPLRSILKPGARDLFHTTAVGRAVVASLPRQQQTRLIGKVCALEPSASRRAARSRLEAELAATRARGCAWEEAETVAGVACVAVPLSSLGEPLAAVSIAVPIKRLTPARRRTLEKALRACHAQPVASLAAG